MNVFGKVISVIIGYARVSTEDQHLDAQISALEAIGAERIFAEKISGTKKSRPELDRMIEQLRDGDVVVVTKYDRLSRSLQDLLSIVEAVGAKGAGFRSLAEDIDTTTPAGRLVFHVFASIGTPCRGCAYAGSGGPWHCRAGASVRGQPKHHQAGLS